MLVKVTPGNLRDPGSKSIASALIRLQLVPTELGGQAKAVTGRDEAGGEVRRDMRGPIKRNDVATCSVLADL